MPDEERMQRVRGDHPCPICGKPDWCLVAPDKSAAICARVAEGSVKRCGDAGWLHILHEDVDRPRAFSTRIAAKTDDASDFGPLARHYQAQLTAGRLNTVAISLGVSAQSLKRLRIGWDGEAYTFPMSDSENRIIGVRRRSPSGYKLSVTGSVNGLFVPTGLDSGKRLLICEGATDTAAALDLGFDAVGRPNCSSRVEMTARAARGRTEIVIVGDDDPPGRRGAEKLADALALHYPSVKVVYPPENIKDLRDWLRAGLSRETLHRIIEETEPIRLKVGFRD